MNNPAASLLSRIDPGKLPAISRVLLDLMNAVQQPDISLQELAKIIGQDTSLSVKVLAAANAPLYRQWGELTDLRRALVVLGLTTVKTIAVTQAVQQFFNKLSPNQDSLLELIWYRSLSCAHLAQKLALLTAYNFPDEAYLAGLMHRLGQIILLAGFPNEYPKFLIHHLDGQHSREQQLFGVFHNEMGAYFIAGWKLKSFMSDAVLYQHYPVEAIADSSRLVKIIHLASHLSSLNATNKELILAQAGALFDLNQALLTDMLMEIKPLVKSSAESLGIDIALHEEGGIINLTTPVQRQIVHNQLGENVKDFALSAAVRQQLQSASEISNVAGIIQLNLQMLFGFQRTAIFNYNADGDCLDGISGNANQPDSLWPTLSISCKSGQSLPAQALLEKQLKDSFSAIENTVTLGDRQILRLLETEGMLIIPMFNDRQSVGVIIVGLSRHELERLKINSKFVVMFANQAASVFSATQTITLQNHLTATEALRADYQLHARKLAHEISNPLSIINNYLYLLGLRLGEDNAEEIKLIQEEIDRVGQILVRLPEAPEHISEADHDIVNVNGLIGDLIKLFEAGLFKSHAINIDLKLDDALTEITGNRNKLKQILINLLKNAVEAMAFGGKITVSTKDKIYIGKYCYVEIQVQDEGPGLPDAVSNQLFVPVTSSKGKNHQGLGLTIAKNLTEDLGGILSCSTTAGAGTSFKIFLPRIIDGQK